MNIETPEDMLHAIEVCFTGLARIVDLDLVAVLREGHPPESFYYEYRTRGKERTYKSVRRTEYDNDAILLAELVQTFDQHQTEHPESNLTMTKILTPGALIECVDAIRLDSGLIRIPKIFDSFATVAEVCGYRNLAETFHVYYLHSLYLQHEYIQAHPDNRPNTKYQIPPEQIVDELDDVRTALLGPYEIGLVNDLTERLERALWPEISTASADNPVHDYDWSSR